MRGLAAVVAVTVWTTSLACHRPIHRRTYVFADPARGRWDHPADVPEDAVRVALVGRVHAADMSGMPRAVARAFRKLGPGQVVWYRRPGGGAYLLGVRGGALVVRAHGRPGKSDAYPLGELRRVAPPKTIELGEVDAASRAGAELVVESAFAVTQYVFVNGTFAGTVAAGQTQVFPAPAGDVEVLCADAADGTNAARARVKLAAGRRQRLTVMPKL